MKALGMGAALVAPSVSAPLYGTAQASLTGDRLMEVTGEPDPPNMIQADGSATRLT